MLGRHRTRTVVLTVVAATMAAAGFAFYPSHEGPTARATANSRRFVLILAGVSGQSESGKFDLEVAALEMPRRLGQLAHRQRLLLDSRWRDVRPAIIGRDRTNDLAHQSPTVAAVRQRHDSVALAEIGYHE